MPLYEYECGSCRERTEVIQKFSDDPLQVCESCGGALRKLISSPAIQFKGSGFYITDYSRSSGKDGSKDSGSKDSSAKDSGSKDSSSKDASSSAGAASSSDSSTAKPASSDTKST